MKLGIRSTLTLGLLALLLMAGAVAALLAVRPVEAAAEAQVVAQQQARLLAMAAELEAAPGELTPRLTRLLKSPDLTGALVVDSRLQRLAGQESAALPRQAGVLTEALDQRALAWERVPSGVLMAVPLTLSGRRCVLGVRFSLQSLEAELARQQWVVVLYLGGSFSLVLVFGVYLSGRLVVAPVKRLTEAARQIAQGEPPTALPTLKGPLELADLSQSLAEMVAHLSAKNEALAASLSALELAKDRLVTSEKLAVVGRLAAGIAHEVGNPLTAVMGFVDYLREGAEPALQAELLTRMDQELNRIRATLRQLLDLTRPAPAEPVPTALAPVVHAAVALLRYHRGMKGVTFDIQGDAPLAVVDPSRLQQVLVNLFLNAAEAMEGQGRIRVGLAAEGSRCVLTVQDEGPGVAPELVERLFDPFVSTKPTGHGLGLAIARRLLEESGGTLSLLESTQGACFELTVPKAT